MMVSEIKEEECKQLENGNNEEKSRRHPRWTRQETLTLIQAKDITENGPYKGRKIWSSITSENNVTEPKWVMISGYCKQQGVCRAAAQCRKRWSNLIGDYKKIKSWEGNLKDGNKAESFWAMRNDLRKEKKLPVSFDWEVFKVLEGREVGGVGVGDVAFSPLPLQAVAAVSDGSFGGDEEDGVDGMDVEVAEDVEPEHEHEHEHENENENENENGPVNENEENVVEDVVGLAGDQKEEEIMELGLKSKDEASAKRLFESPGNNPEPSSDGLRESWQGISYWNSEEKAAKRRRQSTEEPKASNLEEEIMKVLEENNKMVTAQLDIHNKNIQLDREQRKETNDVLVAALGKLTNVLAKIAEKL